MFLLFQPFIQDLKHHADIPGHSLGDQDILIHLRRIDIKLKDLRVARELLRIARHTVTESGADNDQQIALADPVIRRLRAMHPKHPCVKRVRSRKCALPHQGIGHRCIHLPDEGTKLLAGIREDRTAAYEYIRLLRLADQRRLDLCLADLPGRKHRLWRLLLIFCLIRRHILRNVDKDRPRPSLLRNSERFADGVGEVVHILHYIVMLRDRHCHSCNVDFLETVFSQKIYPYITGDRHDRYGVHIRGGNPRNKVGRPRSAGGKAHAGLPCRPCIPVGCMGGSLLMGGQDMRDLISVFI